MNKRDFILGLASIWCCSSVAAKSASASLELRIEHVSATGQIAVSMHSTGHSALRLWRAGRWNVAPWRVLHISAASGKLQTYYEDPNQIFNDSPLYFDVSPEKPHVVELDLTNGWWLPRSKDRNLNLRWEAGDTLIAIYDIESSADAQKHSVWTGVVAAKADVP